jgi:SAM-dependent methyltransferase
VTSLVYRDPRVYRAVLRALYGKALAERERIVSLLVPRGATVLDVCCGDGGIARALPGVRYLGVDASEAMVAHVRAAGFEARVLDVSKEALPEADVVLLLGSLYQFLPDPEAVLLRLRRAARRFAVVAEPHVNLSTAGWPVVSALARRATDPGVASSTERFDEASLRALFARHGARHLERTARETIAVLPGTAA